MTRRSGWRGVPSCSTVHWWTWSSRAARLASQVRVARSSQIGKRIVPSPLPVRGAGRRHLGRTHPRRRAGRRVLLEEARLLHAVGPADPGDRAVLEVRQQHRRDLRVVVEHLALGRAGARVEHLVEVADRQGAALDVDLQVAHPGSPRRCSGERSGGEERRGVVVRSSGVRSSRTPWKDGCRSRSYPSPCVSMLDHDPWLDPERAVGVDARHLVVERVRVTAQRGQQLGQPPGGDARRCRCRPDRGRAGRRRSARRRARRQPAVVPDWGRQPPTTNDPRWRWASCAESSLRWSKTVARGAALARGPLEALGEGTSTACRRRRSPPAPATSCHRGAAPPAARGAPRAGGR